MQDNQVVLTRDDLCKEFEAQNGLFYCEHDSFTLDLDDYTCIELSAAEKLADLIAWWKESVDVSLNGLRDLSPQVAERLASGIRDELLLNGLQTISAETAAALSVHSGCTLSLDGIGELSADTAAQLARHRGGSLSLNGLTSISNETARSLSCHKGVLSLAGITSLSDESAGFLASHEGRLYLRNLKKLSDEGARQLALARGDIISSNTKFMANRKRVEREKQDALQEEKNAALKSDVISQANGEPEVGKMTDAGKMQSRSSQFDLWRAVDVSFANLLLTVGVLQCVASAIVYVYRMMFPEEIDYSLFQPPDLAGVMFVRGVGTFGGGKVARSFIRPKR